MNMKIYLTCILSCLFLSQAQAQFAPFVVVSAGEAAYDTAAFVSSSQDTAVGDGTTFTLNHTVGSDNNRLLMAYLIMAMDGTHTSVDSVKRGSQHFTFVDSANNVNWRRLEVWRLVAPTTGAGTITWYLSRAPASGGYASCFGVGEFKNVDQATPIASDSVVPSGSRDSVVIYALPTTAEKLVVGACYKQGTNMGMDPLAQMDTTFDYDPPGDNGINSIYLSAAHRLSRASEIMVGFENGTGGQDCAGWFGVLNSNNPPPITYFADDFAGESGDLHDRANWTEEEPGDVTVQGNGTIRTTSSSGEDGAYWDADTFADDQWAMMIASEFGASSSLGPAVRMSASADSFYSLYCDNDKWYVSKVIGGVWASLANGAFTPSEPDTFYCEIIGSTLRAEINGVEVYNATQSQLTSGSAGMHVYNGGYTYFDYWVAGDIE
jgi:hypothetical protein